MAFSLSLDKSQSRDTENTETTDLRYASTVKNRKNPFNLRNPCPKDFYTRTLR